MENKTQQVEIIVDRENVLYPEDMHEMESNTQQLGVPMPNDEIVQMESNTQQLGVPMPDDEIVQMNNNTQAVQSALQDKINMIANSLQNKEYMNSSKRKCCIYKVPDYIKKGHEECYRPSVISIGPVFYEDKNLESMQELKLIFLNSFMLHHDNAFRNLNPYIDFVREKEEEIRDYYQQKIRLSSDEFIEMIVLDAAFLIYLFSYMSGFVQPLIPLKNELKVHIQYIWRDSFVMENQLPFFVLTKIYNIAFVKVCSHRPFIDLALEYIKYVAASHGAPRPEAITSIIQDNMITDASSIQHLLDLRRKCCCIHLTHQTENPRLLNHRTGTAKQLNHRTGTAKQLSAVGVTFKAIESENQFEIKFDKNNGVLTIPKLSLFDGDDALYRNILFFEQFESGSFESGSFYFRDYIYFFDGLIDSVEDIQILEQNEILNNFFGSEQDVADLFNNFTKNLPIRGSPAYLYSSVEKDLKKYTSTQCNKWKAILWSKYFIHPWAIISVIAAVILFILTSLQTISSFTCK